MFLYHQAGVKEYWIVDPNKQMVSVYGFEMEQAEHYSFGEEIPVGIIKGLSIKVEWFLISLNLFPQYLPMLW